MGAAALELPRAPERTLWDDEIASLLVAAPRLSASACTAVMHVLRAVLDDAATDDETRIQIGVTIAKLRRLRLVAVRV
jgi:hypothetical protein